MTFTVHRHDTPEEMAAALGVPVEPTEVPEATATPCIECPWRRDSARGWLGPYDAEKWLSIVHGEAAIACHITLAESGSWEGGARQCAGAAQFRANVFKSPRDPRVATADERDDTKVFGGNEEFLAHHQRRGDAHT